MQDDNRIELTVSVSRMATGKDGYRANKFEFGNSFRPENHDLDSLINLVAVHGYPFTAVIDTEPPGAQAKKRNTSTIRHTENFIESWIIALDDDGRLPHSVEFWKDDPFFNRYGAFYYESSSSSAEKEKLRPVFIVSTPLRHHGQLSEALAAFHEMYPRCDRLTDAVRVFYGAPSSRSIYAPGNILPIQVLMDKVVTPYREEQEHERRTIAARRMEFIDSARKKRGDSTGEDKAVRALLRGRMEWFHNKLSHLRQGNSRNSMLYWAGRYIAGGETSHWVSEHQDLLFEAEALVLAAFVKNGYADQYGGEEEILRVYRQGKRAGGEPWEMPELAEDWFTFQIGELVDIHIADKFLKRGLISERKRPPGQAGLSYSGYKLEGDSTIYGEWQTSAVTGEHRELDDVHPPLTEGQRKQVKTIIDKKVVQAWRDSLSQLKSPPLPASLLEYLGYGYDSSVNKVTGEIYNRLALPVTAGGGMVNVEYYDVDSGRYSYEYGGESPPWVSECDDCHTTVVLPDTLSAQQWWSEYGGADGVQVIGLPQTDVASVDDFGSNVVFVMWDGETLKDRGLGDLYNSGRQLSRVSLPAPPRTLPPLGRDTVQALIRGASPI